MGDVTVRFAVTSISLKMLRIKLCAVCATLCEGDPVRGHLRVAGMHAIRKSGQNFPHHVTMGDNHGRTGELRVAVSTNFEKFRSLKTPIPKGLEVSVFWHRLGRPTRLVPNSKKAVNLRPILTCNIAHRMIVLGNIYDTEMYLPKGIAKQS